MPSFWVKTLKLSMSSLLLGSVMSAVFAATGIPPLFPIRAWIFGLIVMSMNLYARSLFLALVGTTHMLPAEPGDIVAPGNRKVPHWRPLISDVKRLYHQLPEKKIGYFPDSNPVPASLSLIHISEPTRPY